MEIKEIDRLGNSSLILRDDDVVSGEELDPDYEKRPLKGKKAIIRVDIVDSLMRNGAICKLCQNFVIINLILS